MKMTESCTCGNPTALWIYHRKASPCYFSMPEVYEGEAEDVLQAAADEECERRQSEQRRKAETCARCGATRFVHGGHPLPSDVCTRFKERGGGGGI